MVRRAVLGSASRFGSSADRKSEGSQLALGPLDGKGGAGSPP